MGQVHVASVRMGRLPEVIVALRGVGFDVLQAEGQRYHCRRGDREILLQIDSGGRDSDEALVVLPHPPYTIWPWRWGGDGRFFDDVTAVLDDFVYRT